MVVEGKRGVLFVRLSLSGVRPVRSHMFVMRPGVSTDIRSATRDLALKQGAFALKQGEFRACKNAWQAHD
jgi:hypothetical protein